MAIFIGMNLVPTSRMKKMIFNKQPQYSSQTEMMAHGSPEDHCGRCNCLRRHHQNKKTYSYAKTQASSGRSREIPITAVTSCECPHCFCFCIGFIEPDKEMEKYFNELGGSSCNGTTIPNPTNVTRAASSSEPTSSKANDRPTGRKRAGRPKPIDPRVRSFDF